MFQRVECGFSRNLDALYICNLYQKHCVLLTFNHAHCLAFQLLHVWSTMTMKTTTMMMPDGNETVSLIFVAKPPIYIESHPCN